MVADLLAASRRPLQNLLRDCRFSEWENIALFLDGGATEAVRWAGGLGFVLEELGISLVLDLQVVYSNMIPCRWRLGMIVSWTRSPPSENVFSTLTVVHATPSLRLSCS